MNLDIGPHVAEDVLEKYLLHQLPEAQTECVEEHLLVCPVCQDQAQQIEDFILTARAALRSTERKPAVRSATAGASGALLSWFSAPVIATAALGLMVGSYLQSRPAPPPAPPVEVSLVAMRGADFALTHVRTSDRLVLNLDTQGLPAGGYYQVRIVNSAGIELWRGIPDRSNGRTRAEVPGTLSAGHYWVRLYGGGEIVREYGLAID